MARHDRLTVLTTMMDVGLVPLFYNDDVEVCKKPLVGTAPDGSSLERVAETVRARVAFYLGRWVRATDWYPDWQVRFFDRTRAGWRGDLVHESVRVDGPVGRLQGELEHHPYVDMSDHLLKIDSYTTLWARQAHAAGRRTNIADMIAGATWAFLRNYLLKRGFLLGSTGFVISVLNTHYPFITLAKLRELRQSGGART